MATDAIRRHARRVEIARQRESDALESYARGEPLAVTAARWGVTKPTVTKTRQRGLERRAAEEGPSVEAARVLYLERLELLVSAWMPLALGAYEPDPEEAPGQTLPPDPRAAEILLKVLDRVAAASGKGIAPPESRGDINIFVGDAAQRENAIQTIMAGLATVATKRQDIDGELLHANTNLDQLTGRVAIDDKPAPPPAWVPPRGDDG